MLKEITVIIIIIIIAIGLSVVERCIATVVVCEVGEVVIGLSEIIILQQLLFLEKILILVIETDVHTVVPLLLVVRTVQVILNVLVELVYLLHVVDGVEVLLIVAIAIANVNIIIIIAIVARGELRYAQLLIQLVVVLIELLLPLLDLRTFLVKL